MEHDKLNPQTSDKQQKAISCILSWLGAGSGFPRENAPEKALTRQEQALLDGLFAEALDFIVTMPQYDYEELLANLVVACAKPGYEEIVLNLRDKNRLSLIRFIVLMNNKIKSEGRVMPLLKISAETVDTAAGFLLRCGAEQIDCTAETLLKEARAALAPTLLDMLEK